MDLSPIGFGVFQLSRSKLIGAGSRSTRRKLSRLAAPWLLSLSLVSACGGGNDNSGNGSAVSSSGVITSTLATDLSGQLAATAPKRSNVMELTITALGSNQPQTEVNWVAPDGTVSGAASSSNSMMKSTANTLPLTGFLDVAGVSTSTLDLSGTRYITTRIKVRNAPACGAPPVGGTCAPYTTQRQNVTFFAVSTATTINQTAVSRFNRFDGSPANPALTLALLPAHGISQVTGGVEPALASLQVYKESELPAAEPTVTSVFPYGFVVKNTNDGSRVLPANPANNRYDGEVTFGFSIPVQPLPTDDPFKISLRFQTADDTNLRVTQSTQEQTFLGDVGATLRASSLSGSDLAVLGSRLAQTPIGNPICRVRTAGTVDAPTAFLVNQVPATPKVRSAPMNLSFVERTREVSVGFCENMTAPTASTFVVNGSQSGRRVVGGAYGGILKGGGTSNQPNQLIWSISGQRPFFANEVVHFAATSNNTTVGNTAITPFAGSFRVKGSNPGSAGTFKSAPNFTTLERPTAVAIADLNGDSIPDVVTTGETSVSVLIGDGSGGFGAPTLFGVGSNAIALALGDMNGDGKLDVVTANISSNTVSILLGNGNGGFTLVSSAAVAAAPVSIDLGDVNGDGKLDVVVANLNSNNVSVLIGNGLGGLGLASNFSVGAFPRSVKVGDVNGDGNRDIVVANFASSSVSVLLGNGAGGFGASTIFLVGSSPESLALGDLNGDGKLDVVTANRGSNNVTILLGNGAGSFSLSSTLAVGTAPSSVVLGDMNRDGRVDIFVGNDISADLSLLLADSSGGYTSVAGAMAIGGNVSSIAVADVNLDGNLDVVAANFLTGNSPSYRVSILAGNGLREFSAAKNHVVGNNLRTVALGDLNGDGILDIVAAGGTSVSVLLGTGSGGFAAASPYLFGGISAYALALADMNGDGMLDAIAADFGSSAVFVLLGNGSGGFSATTTQAVGSNPFAVAVGDLNSDGTLDVVVSNFGSNHVSVLLGTGGGSLSSASNIAVGTGPSGVALGDFNGDGRLDIVTTNSGSSSASVLIGDGSGGFSSAVSYSLGSAQISVAVGDMNGDGNLDIVTSGIAQTKILSGTGQGTFGSPIAFGSEVGSNGVVLADVDGDQVLDIVTTGQYNRVSVLKGNRTGGFSGGTTFGTGTRPVGIAIGDVNLDGKLDVVSANDSSGNVSILFGQ